MSETEWGPELSERMVLTEPQFLHIGTSKVLPTPRRTVTKRLLMDQQREESGFDPSVAGRRPSRN